jgi:glycosyltransferase involved in cell wall biosynthesis
MTSEGPSKPQVTIITPVYNEALGIDHYEAAVTESLLSRGDIDFRILFVDDGSTDGSWEKIQKICSRSPAFSAIRLSRNFGAHIALSAGIDHAEGDAVATLACDLQDPPEVILDFVDRWRKGAQIVWGVRRTRQEGRIRRAMTNAFVALIRRYAMPKNSMFTTGSFLLIDRKVADCFRQFREHSRVTFALVAWTGFDQAIAPYDRRARTFGSSGWTLSKLLRTIYDILIGFSELPARVLTTLGFCTFAGSMVFLVFLVVEWLVTNVAPGWTGIMALVTLLFGILFMMVGLMAEYMYRIFLESTNRPLYFVSRTTSANKVQNE